MARRSRSGAPRPIVHWVGDQLAGHSLAHVNRELVRRLAAGDRFRLRLLSGEDPAAALPSQRDLARLLRPAPPEHPAVTVRHRWPPELGRPERGAHVLVQPWEFGGLPAPWIGPARDDVDEVWCYTSFVADRYLDAGVDPDRVVVVPLGVDTDRFRPDGPRLLDDDGRTRFLFVGGTIARKGIDVLLDAWSAAFGLDDPVELVVKASEAGGAYRGASAAAAVAELAGRAAPIRLVDGDLPGADLAALYRSCHALVHPYRGEGFGLPVAEAMASGLPVVVTAGGATDDFCTDDTAFRIPSTRRPIEDATGLPPAGPDGYWLLEPDRDALVETLRHLATRPLDATVKSEAGAAHVREHLRWDRSAAVVADRLVALATAGPRRRSAGAAPLLSACLIVKDEEELLPGCLESLAGLVDELVVYDTGSTDATRAIAAAAGATVVEGYWDDDFGRARNAALAACTGRWILHVDADERVEPTSDLAALRAALADDTTPDLLLVEIANRDAGGRPGARHRGVRLFRRARAHWAGRLHEQVVARPAQVGPPLRREPTDLLVLDHLGYQAEVMAARDKATRNVRLAEADLADGGQSDPVALLLNLARSLTVAGRLEDALARCEDARASASTTTPELRAAVLHHGVEVLFSLGRPADARPWIAGLRAAAPASTRLVDFLAGTADLLEGRPAPQLADLADDEVWNDVSGLAVAGDLVRHRRSLALAAAGRWPEAVEPLATLAAHHPDLPVWGLLARALHATDPAGGPDRFAGLVLAAPDEARRRVLAHVLLTPVEVADAAGEALWARAPGDARLVAFAAHHGARCPTGTALEWAARVRSAGLTNRCPLVTRAAAPNVDPVERIRAACAAYTAFGDHRAGTALVAAARALTDDRLPEATLVVDDLAPALLDAFVATIGEQRLGDALAGAASAA